MSAGITLEEMLAWSEEASAFWKAHLDANPALLELPCGIGGAANVQAFIRHIWAAELRWGQRLAGLPVIDMNEVPAGPLDALFDLHRQAGEVFSALLDLPQKSWEGNLRDELRLGSPGGAKRLPPQGCSPCAVSQPAPLGTVVHTHSGGWIPVRLPGGLSVQFGAGVGPG
jgi:hypothetical protein